MSETTAQGWRQLAASIRFENQAFIGGTYVDAAAGKTFESVNPATGALLAHVAACDAIDVDHAVRAARVAYESGAWSRCDPAERRAALLRFAEAIRREARELALLDTLDMGKTISDSFGINVPASAATLQWYAEAIDKVYDEIAPTAPGNLALVRRAPLGVVGAVVPWNFPIDIAIWKIAPALAAGNSVVLKPAEQSPHSALRLARLAADSGIPEGVFNVVPGIGEIAGRALGLHHDVDCLAFTGSTEVGKLFMRYSSESNMKQVWLECGGKSPNVVFADAADLDEAADMAVFAAFWNQGAVCSANSRLLVERSIKDGFVRKLIERASAYSPADPLDPEARMGAIVSDAHARSIMRHVERGKTECRLADGGTIAQVDGRGCFIRPTIFDEVVPSHPLARDEIFGPVLAVIAFDTEDEAVRIANDTQYGLAASLWTSRLDRAHRVAERLRAGTVSVNTVDAISPQTPFGGFGQSGFGRDLSLHALDKYSALKTTWIKYAGRSQ